MSAASPADGVTASRKLRAQFMLSDPGFETKRVDEEQDTYDEEHMFFQDKNILTKLNRHLHVIPVYERDLTQINPRGLMVFALSKQL